MPWVLEVLLLSVRTKLAQYYLSFSGKRVGRVEERLVFILWAVYVLLGLDHAAADPELHVDPLLPVAGLVRVHQAWSSSGGYMQENCIKVSELFRFCRVI